MWHCSDLLFGKAQETPHVHPRHPTATLPLHSTHGEQAAASSELLNGEYALMYEYYSVPVVAKLNANVSTADRLSDYASS